jgi:hypothetical protein
LLASWRDLARSEAASPDADVVRPASSLDVDQYLAGDAPKPWQVAPQFLHDTKHLVGAALAAIAIKSLLERDSNQTEEADWPREPAKRIQKTRARLLSREC